MADRRSWWQRLPQTAAYPLSVGGIFTCVFLGFFSWVALIMGVAGLVTSFAGLVVAGLVVTTVFEVMRTSANGHTGMPEWAEFRNIRRDVIAPGLKALVLVVVFSLPAMAVQMGFIGGDASNAAALEKDANPLGNMDASQLLSGLGGGGPDYDAMQKKISGGTDPKAELAKAAAAAKKPDPPMHWSALGIALALGGAGLFPLALLILGISQSLLMALNPVAWVGILKNTLASYLGLLVGLALLAGAGALATWPLEALSERLPIVPSIIAESIDIYVVLVAAHMLGRFVWVNHEQLGYTPEEHVEMDVARVAAIKAATLAELERRGRARPAAPRGPAPK